MSFRTYFLAPLAAASLALAACSTDPTFGNGGGNPASGSASGSNSNGANSQLQHCDHTIGTLAIEEDQAAPWYTYLYSQYQLPSTVPLLRLIVQQSNCFVIVDRGRAFNTMMGERSLAQSGELRAGSRFGKGQMVSADYSMSPSINFSQQGGQGVGAALGFVPGVGGLLSVAAAGMKSNSASTTLLLVDNRSGVQLSAAQGSAKNWDFAGLGGLIGSGGAGGIGGYSSTPEGKIITAAFIDSYNQMVIATKDYKAQTVKGGLGKGGNLPVGQ
jgi:curli biogenesis system outer membrane secretion channel CsgG